MFETSQQDQSSGSGKIVGGVIAVIAVILVAAYFMWFNVPHQSTVNAPAAGDQAAANAEAKPLEDMKIIKMNLRRDDATQTQAVWDIQVANNSKTFAYKNLKYSTKYYNAEGAVVGQNQGTLDGIVQSADQFSFSGVNDGLYPVGTARYTVELTGADAIK